MPRRSQTSSVVCDCDECGSEGKRWSKASYDDHILNQGLSHRFGDTSPLDENSAQVTIFAQTLLDSDTIIVPPPPAQALSAVASELQAWSASNEAAYMSDTLNDEQYPVSELTDAMAECSIDSPRGGSDVSVARLTVALAEHALDERTRSTSPGSQFPTASAIRYTFSPDEMHREKITTTKARRILDQINKKADEYAVRLQMAPHTVETLRLVDKDLRVLREHLSLVTLKSSGRINDLRSLVDRNLKSLNDRLDDHVSKLPGKLYPKVFYDCDYLYTRKVDHLQPLAQLSLFIVAFCTIILSVGTRGSECILLMVQAALNTAFSLFGQSAKTNPEISSIMKQIPNTLATVLERFQLDGKPIVYARCPSCHCLYPPSYLPGSQIASYPLECTNVPILQGDVCGTRLYMEGNENRQGASEERLVATFEYYSFKEYQAQLLARPDIERLLVKSCKDFDVSMSAPQPSQVLGVFDADFLREFPGPRGETRFVTFQNEELRLVFSLNVDFFNVNGMTEKGSSTSCGVISMACLNLPVDIRYKAENMYLAGVIPGPREPQGQQLNHYLRPLVEDLVESWDVGVRFSRTALHEKGRHVRAAIAISVCDLPAARHVSQQAGHQAHHFCTVCNLYHKDNRDHVDYWNWKVKDSSEVRFQAERWRDASTEGEREELFTRYGVRYSVLWLLPYWSPSRMLVVDAMHALLEGLVHNHFRYVLGLTESAVNQKPVQEPAFDYDFKKPLRKTTPGEPKRQRKQNVKLDPQSAMMGSNTGGTESSLTNEDIDQVDLIHNVLVSPLSEEADPVVLNQVKRKLLAHRKAPLQFVVDTVLNNHPATTRGKKTKKEVLANDLAKWRLTHPRRTSSPLLAPLATKETLERVQEVIRDTVVPAWLSQRHSVPVEFGKARTGTLKADEWRTLVVIYLPIALVSLWGRGTRHETFHDYLRCRDVLDHTMALVTAVILALSRTMTRDRARLYRAYICEYIGNLLDIHPTTGLKTNFHVSIHIYDFLLLFGPVYSWWTFPFERLIGVLQRIPTNGKFGQLESTILNSYTRAAALRRWIGRPDCPAAIKHLQSVVEKYFGTDSTDDCKAPEKEHRVVPPKDLCSALGSTPQVIMHAHHTKDGKNYSRRSTHLGNSLIYYYPSTGSPAVAGSIKYIYTDNRRRQMAVQRHLPADLGTIDPFEPYTFYPATILSSRLSDTLEIIEPDSIKCHIARWQFSKDKVVVVCLDGLFS